MKSYKPVGWRSESYRHYLAAKGYRTKHRYYAMDNVELTDDKPFYQQHKFKSEGVNLRMHDLGKEQQRVMNELDAAVSRGELIPEKREEFITGDFKTLKEQYINKYITKSQFDDELNRSLVYFLKVNNKKLKVFFWAEKNKGEKDTYDSTAGHVGSGVI